MVRRRSCLLASLVLGLLLSASSTARAQDAQGSAFNLQLFRHAIDSKGYITVNASQILGHLEFSIGLIGTWAHSVMPLKNTTGQKFDVTDLITPQVQAAIG